MNKKYLFIGGILLIGLVAWGFYLYNKPHTSTAHERPDFSIPAVDLYNAYQKDESGANNKFLGKVIEVKGSVSEVHPGKGNTDILMDATATGGGVNCSFPNIPLSQLQTLKKGNIITVKGRCTGFLMDVNLVDCVTEE